MELNCDETTILPGMLNHVIHYLVKAPFKIVKAAFLHSTCLEIISTNPVTSRKIMYTSRNSQIVERRRCSHVSGRFFRGNYWLIDLSDAAEVRRMFHIDLKTEVSIVCDK